MRVAQIGTFDLDNLGDLLFPWVFSRIVEKLAKKTGEPIELVYFSPKGNSAKFLYTDHVETLPIELFDEEDLKRKFDRIFIGGGDIVREDDWSLGSVYREGGPVLTFSHILSPTISPDRRFVLLSPGAPFSLSEGFRIFLRNSFSRIAHAAVRDEATKRLIEDLCPADIQMSVLPDIVNDIGRQFPYAEVVERARRLLNGIVPESCQYVCFQAHRAVAGDVQGAMDLLRKIEAALGWPIILIEIGGCLGDTEFLVSLSKEGGFPLVSVSERGPMSILDKVAVIANGSGFIGSSLHGNIIASAYGKPHISFVGAMSNKTKGFFAQSETGVLYDKIIEAQLHVSDIIAFLLDPKSRAPEIAQETIIEDHIRACLFSESFGPSPSSFNKYVDAAFKESHKLVTELKSQLEAEKCNAQSQILYRDAMISELSNQLEAGKCNAESQILHRDALVAELENQLEAEKCNAESQILHRDALVAELKDQLEAEKCNAESQILYRDALVLELKNQLGGTSKGLLQRFPLLLWKKFSR